MKKAVFWLDGEQLHARDGAGGRAYCVPRRTMRGASRGESRVQTQCRSAPTTTRRFRISSFGPKISAVCTAEIAFDPAV
ncbi:hypothetical protein [Paraburkholderia guartelaensis]|uniref:hypothetical protein n=1 Tax=Paraburkholderia guartelaensis TaxID=2546446 RepID=UPI002AB75CEF|nr:hypothetical protein [Paraburkholderia guartelaensis]